MPAYHIASDITGESLLLVRSNNRRNALSSLRFVVRNAPSDDHLVVTPVPEAFSTEIRAVEEALRKTRKELGCGDLSDDTALRFELDLLQQAWLSNTGACQLKLTWPRFLALRTLQSDLEKAQHVTTPNNPAPEGLDAYIEALEARILVLEARVIELQKNQDLSLELEETTGFYHIGKNASTQYTLKLIRTQNKEVISEIYLDFTPLSEDP